ncbi:MAG: hypothetical protein ACXU8U_06950 [Asticcacaulis sp.]
MRKMIILSAVAALTWPVASYAADNAFIGLRLSTLGGGIEVGSHFAPNWSGRLIANGFDYNANRNVDNIDYRGKLKMASFGAQLDWHPMADGPFYLTGGLYANGNKVHATATPATTTNIGSVPFTPAQIGTITADGKFRGAAPYLGLGGRWPVGALDINLEAGAYFQGKPRVAMTSNGTYASDPTYQQQLEIERKNLQNDLNTFSTYPVVALGVAYHF